MKRVLINVFHVFVCIFVCFVLLIEFVRCLEDVDAQLNDCTTCLSDKDTRVLESTRVKSEADWQKLFYDNMYRRDPMSIARQFALIGEASPRIELGTMLGMIGHELDCTIPELEAAHSWKSLEWDDDSKECNGFNLRVASGWFGYVHATVPSMLPEFKATSCLRRFQIHSQYHWALPTSPTMVLLRDRAKATGKKGFSYKSMGEYYSRGWTLLVIDSDVTDKRYFFYSGDTKNSPPVASWGGSAHAADKRELFAWLKKEAPGIPSEMGECWAEAVSHNQL